MELLRSLSVDLPQRVERGVVEADAIQGQVTTHPAAMTFLTEVPDVSTLRTGAAGVGDAVARPKPPYLRLDEQMTEVEAGLTRARAVVDQGIADHEASQRALANAASAIAAARDQVVHGDVGGAARQLLEEAQSLLARRGGGDRFPGGDHLGCGSGQGPRGLERQPAPARTVATPSSVARQRGAPLLRPRPAGAARVEEVGASAVGVAAAVAAPAAVGEARAASAVVAAHDAAVAVAPAGSDPHPACPTFLP